MASEVGIDKFVTEFLIDWISLNDVKNLFTCFSIVLDAPYSLIDLRNSFSLLSVLLC